MPDRNAVAIVAVQSLNVMASPGVRMGRHSILLIVPI
jgi:hypothetical protein